MCSSDLLVECQRPPRDDIGAVADEVDAPEQAVEAVEREGDVVVGISASGNSPNVLSAIRYANAHGATTVGLTGFDGGELAKICGINVHVPTAKGEYGPVEDVHMIIDHLTSAWLIQFNRMAKVVPLAVPQKKRA